MCGVYIVCDVCMVCVVYVWCEWRSVCVCVCVCVCVFLFRQGLTQAGLSGTCYLVSAGFELTNLLQPPKY